MDGSYVLPDTVLRLAGPDASPSLVRLCLDYKRARELVPVADVRLALKSV